MPALYYQVICDNILAHNQYIDTINITLTKR